MLKKNNIIKGGFYQYLEVFSIAICFFLFSLFPVNADINNFDDAFLLARGYTKENAYFPQEVIEFEHYQKTHQKIIISTLHWEFVSDDVIYHFFFVSEDEPNYSVAAYYKGQKYVKLNKTNDMPDLWLSMDINGDGVITEGEGRNAWY